MFKMLKITLAVAAASSMYAGAAAAQQESAGQLEEVLVTARKKVENLQQTPLDISTFSADQIRQLDISTTADVARYTPSLTFDVGVLPNDTRPAIRGVSTNRGRPNVAVLVDFVDVSSESLTVAGGGMTANLRLLDLERVEIVKGPATAFYGRSAFSGAINYISKRPTEEFSGEVSADLDEHNSQDLRLMLSGPLTDTLGGRLNVSGYKTDGWYENPNTGGELGNADSKCIALALNWQPNERFTAYLRGEYSEEEYSPRAQAFDSSLSKDFDPAVNFFGTGTVRPGADHKPYEFSPDAVCDEASRQRPFWDSFNAGPACRPINVGKQSAGESDIDLSADPRTGQDFVGTEIDNKRVHLELDYRVGDVKIAYLGGYTDNKTSIQEDFDFSDDPLLSLVQGTPFDFSQFGFSAMSQQTHELKQYSHELRVSGESDRFAWMVSGLRWEEKMDTAFADEWWLREGGDAQWLIDNVLGFAGITEVATGPGNTPATPISRDTEHWSAALSLTFVVTETINLTFEGRYVDEKIKYAGSSEDRSFYSAFGFGPGEMTFNEVEDSDFIPRFNIDWHPNDHLMFYASYAEGFKPGGVATVDGNGDVSNGEFKPEQLKTYEFGVKSDWAEDTLRLNATAFFNEYTDQQVPYFFTDPMTGLLNSTVINAGETEINGLELDAIWHPIESLTFSLSYIWVDAEYTDFNTREILAEAGGEPNESSLAQAGNADADFTGNTVIGVPENALSLSARYDHYFNNGLSGYVEVIGNYQDKRYLDQGNNLYLPEHTLWDLFVGLSGQQWTATFYTYNLADEDKIQSGLLNVDYGFLPDGQNVPFGANLILPQPRTIGARIAYRF